MWEVTDKLRRQIALFDTEQAVMDLVDGRCTVSEAHARAMEARARFEKSCEATYATPEYRGRGRQGEPIFERDGDAVFLTGRQGEVIWVN